MFIDDDTEAYHLYEMYDGDDAYDEYDEDEVKYEIENDEIHYSINKLKRVGSVCRCAGPLCNRKFTKKQYAQAFCCNKCKDQFWNRREAFFGYRKKVEIKKINTL